MSVDEMYPRGIGETLKRGASHSSGALESFSQAYQDFGKGFWRLCGNVALGHYMPVTIAIMVRNFAATPPVSNFQTLLVPIFAKPSQIRPQATAT